MQVGSVETGFGWNCPSNLDILIGTTVASDFKNFVFFLVSEIGDMFKHIKRA